MKKLTVRSEFNLSEEEWSKFKGEYGSLHYDELDKHGRYSEKRTRDNYREQVSYELDNYPDPLGININEEIELDDKMA